MACCNCSSVEGCLAGASSLEAAAFDDSFWLFSFCAEGWSQIGETGAQSKSIEITHTETDWKAIAAGFYGYREELSLGLGYVSSRAGTWHVYKTILCQ